MTYNVFGGTLSLTQSINQSYSDMTNVCLMQNMHLLLQTVATANAYLVSSI